MKKNWMSLFVTLIVTTSLVGIPAYKARAAVQTPIVRSQVEQRAVNMIDLAWTYSADKNSNIDPKYASNVTLPKQLQGVTTAQFTGIPYDWGGIDGIDTYSYQAPWINFLDAINKGAFTGNVNTNAGYGYVAGTAGVDCSGFVQAAFNIKDYKQSTSTLLNNYFQTINLSDLKHMDILDKPGDHVVIFDKWGTFNGIDGAFTYEATPDQTYGGIQGTKRYFISMKTINTGYIPARYVNIADDTTSQTTSSTTTSTSSSTSTTSTSSSSTTSTPTTSTSSTTATGTTSTTTSSSTAVTSTSTTSTTAAAPTFKVGGYAQVANVTSYANLRANPGTSYSLITIVPKGTILKLMNYTDGWYQVSYNGQTGWIWGNTLGAVPAGQYVTVNGVYQLNIRLTPSSTAQILGTLTQGQIAQKIDQTTDGSWYKININGIQGWSSSKYLAFIQ